MSLYLTFNIYSLLVEIFLLFCSLLILIFGVIYSTKDSLGYPVLNHSVQGLSILVLILSLILSLNLNSIYLITWNKLLILDSFSFYTKILLIFLGITWFFITKDSLKHEKIYNFEYWVLILFTFLALCFILQVSNLLSAYISIEFLSLILYILTSFKRTSEFSTEAGLKYFILGAFASSLLLFGFSLLYSTTGLTSFNELSLFFIHLNCLENFNLYHIISLSLSFILIALLFKLVVAPFHIWAPDVYEGSPNAITALFAILPKLVIISLILKFILIIFSELSFVWFYIIFFCILASSIIGTFSTFSQTKWKRFIVYSSISHISFILLALISNDWFSLIYLFIYLFIYLIMTLGFFSIFLNFYFFKFPFLYQIRYLNSLKLIITFNPVLAFSLSVILFSMAGIPPMAGFFIKFFVIFSAIQKKMFGLILVLLVCNCISCFYYIRLIKISYFYSELPKRFKVVNPLNKSNTFIVGICIFIILFSFLDIELILLFSNLLSFSFL